MSGEATELEEILDFLVAPKKIARDKGEERLREYVLSASELTFISDWIIDKTDGLSNWEDIYGALTAATILLNTCCFDKLSKIGLIDKVESVALECHENQEFRVRIAAGELMGALCRHVGLTLFLRYLPVVLENICSNLERHTEAPGSELESSLQELELVKERDVNLSQSSLSVFHDTAGWRNLETWMKCLQKIVKGLKCEDFVKVYKGDILDVICGTTEHVNRFVRETSFDVLATIISRHGCHSDTNSQDDSDYMRIAQRLHRGLSDNWSQVRMAASKAARIYFEVDPPRGFSKTNAYPILLPPICLNRYYVAEGVRLYNQETWCRVTQGEGKTLLGHYLNDALTYYIQQSDADNHAVREAACATIAETVSKLDSKLLKPFINQLLDALLTCFGDESWPVRDAACLSLGTLISIFPGETRTAGYPTYMSDIFIRNLCDHIPSVRDGAAQSIVSILKSTNDTKLIQIYLEHIREKLENVKNQLADSHGSDADRVVGTGPGASRAVVYRASDAHDSRHTNQIMYSCSSLAPKLQKGRKGGGCHDGLMHRASEPWEEADGAVRLIGYIAELHPKLFSDELVQQLVNATSYRHYAHYGYFLETVSNVITQLCGNLEKAHFKKYLDDLLCVLADTFDTKLPLAVGAATTALKQISRCIGPNVLHGRVEHHIDSHVTRSLLQYLPSVP